MQFPEPSLSDEFRRQCLFSGDQHVERLPGLGDIVDTERKITDALARKSRGKDHRKKRPPQPRIQFNEHIEVDSRGFSPNISGIIARLNTTLVSTSGYPGLIGPPHAPLPHSQSSPMSIRCRPPTRPEIPRHLVMAITAGPPGLTNSHPELSSNPTGGLK